MVAGFFYVKSILQIDGGNCMLFMTVKKIDGENYIKLKDVVEHFDRVKKEVPMFPDMVILAGNLSSLYRAIDEDRVQEYLNQSMVGA